MSEDTPRVEPIRPQDVVGKQTSRIPEEVIAVFNDLIVEHAYDGRTQLRAVVMQKEAEQLICKRMNVKEPKIHEQRWLDIEPIFRDVGWKVTYKKPIGWGGENFEQHYIFEFDK